MVLDDFSNSLPPISDLGGAGELSLSDVVWMGAAGVCHLRDSRFCVMGTGIWWQRLTEESRSRNSDFTEILSCWNTLTVGFLPVLPDFTCKAFIVAEYLAFKPRHVSLLLFCLILYSFLGFLDSFFPYMWGGSECLPGCHLPDSWDTLKQAVFQNSQLLLSKGEINGKSFKKWKL